MILKNDTLYPTGQFVQFSLNPLASVEAFGDEMAITEAKALSTQRYEIKPGI